MPESVVYSRWWNYQQPLFWHYVASETRFPYFPAEKLAFQLWRGYWEESLSLWLPVGRPLSLMTMWQFHGGPSVPWAVVPSGLWP